MAQPVFVNLKCVPSLNVAHTPDNRLSVRPAEDAEEGIAVRVEPWPFMAPSNTATLHVCGTHYDDSPFMLRVAYAEPVTEVEVYEGWQRTIPWDELGDLRHGSSLVFIFQVAFDDCCGVCPLLFAPLSLRVNVPWQDLTTFTDGDYNDWQAGPAASDPKDLVIVRMPDGNDVLHSKTYTNASNGVVLFKTYYELRVGELYEFSLRTSRSGMTGTKPILALQADDVVVAGPEEIPTLEWVILCGSFIPSSTTMTLSIISEVATGGGNDYYVDDILVRTL